ncbi:hypothetical protein LTR78_001375 [Recurvomyces mirabilis]|uniref:CFEM domain-containing protein n=1 Tax=Recurvomyces mirabilis TaxID=574656 RepID=A0AAE0WVA6_9PEZI|nr:hypothetical protein LTR78_001375 [Recurvomyces mirabilis]KAK5161352.1 hypothetical protein LTS14_001148 [Recurvomyces mirabilis]
MRSYVLLIAATAIAVSAQTASQNATVAALAAQIPACTTQCDDAAFAQVGCGATDYACHCAHGAQLQAILPGCLKNSTCSADDLALFATIPPKICAALNSTTSSTTAAGGNSTGSGIAASSGLPVNSANRTTIMTSTMSGSAGGSTVTSTMAVTSGGVVATNTPAGPSATTGGAASSTSRAAAYTHAANGLLGVAGVGLMFLAL